MYNIIYIYINPSNCRGFFFRSGAINGKLWLFRGHDLYRRSSNLPRCTMKTQGSNLGKWAEFWEIYGNFTVIYGDS